jgi:DNA-binding transcriptional MerR regulator
LDKAPDAFRTISEVADDLDVPQHVLRFWESRFPQIKPMKRGGGRRYYRPDDVDLLRGIRPLLYGEGYTIRGVQRILREQGGRFVQSVWHEGAPQPEPEPSGGAADLEDGNEAEPRLEAPSAAAHKRGDGEPRLGGAQDSATHLADGAPAGRKAASLAPTIASVTDAEPVRPAISREDLQRLQQTMDGLIDCRRLLDEALADGV